MAKRLFVGSLPYETTNNELQDLFSQVGQVESVNLITDKYTGRSKGFAFVEMADDKGAADAIAKFNGYQMGSRTIVVNEARPREERPQFGGGGGGGGQRRDFRRDDRRGDNRGDRQNRW